MRAKAKARLPVVLTSREVASVLAELRGVHWLVACLLYGSGSRLMEAIRLRVKDLDFEHRALVVRNGKGGKDRVVTLPDELVEPLGRHLEAGRTTFDLDSLQGHHSVELPYALNRKISKHSSPMGMAVRLSGHAVEPRPSFGHRPPASFR